MKKEDYIRQIRTDKETQNLFHIGRVNTKNMLYKYLSIDYAIDDIKNGHFIFAEPTCWKDEYETYFYKDAVANMSKANAPKLYASCFSLKENDEGSWKKYSESNNCVKFIIDKKIFIQQICKAPEQEVYLGKVTYLESKDVDRFRNPSSPHYKNLYKNISIENYFSSLLIKRKEFSSEEEFRIFIVPDKERTCDKDKCTMKQAINWKDVITEIIIDSNADHNLKAELIEICVKNGINASIIREEDVYALSNL